MKISAMGLLVLLGGCASLESSDPASPYYAYPSGWVMRLDQPLTIPVDAATVRLQYGRIVPRNGVQEHDPYCVVELNTVRSEPQVLQPGRFNIWRVTRSIDAIAGAPSSFIAVSLGSHDFASSFLYYKTEFHLRSEAQPTIRSMTCAWDQMAPGNRAMMRHLTLEEIRRALGDWMTLLPPKESL